MQNQVAIVMCNRVGKEGDVTFAGQSVVVDPYGNVVSKADDQEQLIIVDIDLTQTAAARKQRPFLELATTRMATTLTRTNRRQPGIFSTMVFKVSKVSSIWSTTCLPWLTISVICLPCGSGGSA